MGSAGPLQAPGHADVRRPGTVHHRRRSRGGKIRLLVRHLPKAGGQSPFPVVADGAGGCPGNQGGARKGQLEVDLGTRDRLYGAQHHFGEKYSGQVQGGVCQSMRLSHG